MKKTVTLDAGESKVVDFTYTPATAKGYIVDVDGLKGGFLAIEVLEAEFVVRDLAIDPAEPYVGEPVSISVVVFNVGNKPGSYEVNCEVI